MVSGMEVDPYELLVRWYLRFNGYLGVENFVVQQTVEHGNIQIGETDVLGVRFPHSREDPGFTLQTDQELLDKQAVDEGLVDFVVAEVKGGQNDTLNKIWREPADPAKIERVGYLIRWLGPLTGSYPIANVLHALLNPHQPRFSRLAPFLVQWQRLLM